MKYFIEEVINNKNLNAASDIVSENFTEHVPLPGQGPGREGLKFALKSMFTGFPDMKWTVQEQIAEGEEVVTKFTWIGTHKGGFMGIAATNKKVEVWGVVIDVVTNKLFSENRLITDNIGLLKQLGIIGLL